MEVGSVSYRVDPACSSEVVMCSVDTTIVLKEVEKGRECASELECVPSELRSLRCPLPGLEDCFHTIVTSILFHRVYAREMEQFDLRLFRGILVCGEHGVGKSAVVGVCVACDVDRCGAAGVWSVHPPVCGASERGCGRECVWACVW